MAVRSWVSNCTFSAGIASLLFFLLIPHLGERLGGSYFRALAIASNILQGRHLKADSLTDIVGMRNLYNGHDPYEMLGPALESVGVKWDLDFANTHPPVNFLFFFPLITLPVGCAIAVWAWTMVAAIIASLRIYGLPWLSAVGVGLLLLYWPPAALSVANVTALWLLGTAVAFRYCNSNQAASGVGIAIASLTKLFPAIMLLPFIACRRRQVLTWFVVVWTVAIMLVSMMKGDVVWQYLRVNRAESARTINRKDNSSFVASAFRYGAGVGRLIEKSRVFPGGVDTGVQWGQVCGVLGATFSLAFLFFVTYANRRFINFSHGPLTGQSLMLALYCSVALLPVSWIYSQLPLLPIVGKFFLERKIATTIIAAAYLFLTTVVDPFGLGSVLILFLATMLVGVGLVLDSSSSKPLSLKMDLSID